jgi:hypothetical protein
MLLDYVITEYFTILYWQTGPEEKTAIIWAT